MKIKPAYQTILWGYQVNNWSEVFKRIWEMGFDGVEIAQAPPSFSFSIEELKNVLDAIGLEFVGFAGGKLAERIDYCGDIRPDYLYLEDWYENSCMFAIDNRFTLALHPHMYKKVHNMETVGILLDQHPKLKFLPDTAHLYIAGDDPCKAIEAYKDRLAAIHLKDWTPIYGRSFHRYAKGFIELGKGDVGVDKVWETLQKINYDGWVVAEQDCTPSDPFESAECAAHWFNDHGVEIEPRSLKKGIPALPSSRSREQLTPDKKAKYYDFLINNIKYKEHSSFCDTLIDLVNDILPCRCMSILEYSPTKDLLKLLSFWPKDKMIKNSPSILKCVECLSGAAVENQVVSKFNPAVKYYNHCFQPEGLISELDLSSMISIPILNTYNPNHVELIVNLYPQNDFPCENLDELNQISESIALAYETLIEDECHSAASTINLQVSKSNTVNEFLDDSIKIIKDILNCEGVAIFLIDPTETKLELRTSTGTEWRDIADNQHFYLKGEGLTGLVWENAEPLLTIDASCEPGRIGKSFETTESEEIVCLLAPLTDSRGNVMGVIRCRNRRGKGDSLHQLNMFTESDVSILDAIGQAIVPHLSVLLAEERRAKTLRRIAHELRTPISVIRGASVFIDRESKRKGYQFNQPHVEDILSWCDLQKRLLINADVFRYTSLGLQIIPEPVYLLSGIFAPARTHIEPLLRDRQFSGDRINHDGFRHIPVLWVDKNYFQQIFFNLLSNAIKYAYNEPRNFKVDVFTEEDENGYIMIFQDTGPGIPEGYELIIFDEGIRGPKASRNHVAGDGLGLWVVKEILEAHGGSIKVSHSKNPTEFTIWLPKKLSRQWKK